jgi:hypothetical protein
MAGAVPGARRHPARGGLPVRAAGQGQPRNLVQPDHAADIYGAGNIDGRPLANAILKQAGLPKAF